jgi:glutamyl-Q tRNA(Asp) synthetase
MTQLSSTNSQDLSRNHSTPTYIGRFAPSPSGALHFGSIVAAIASYLDARANQGQWLVRMEDLDPARETPEAADEILRQLEAFGLHWDKTVLYQSSRLDAYQQTLELLESKNLCFSCNCSRQQVKAMGSVYNGNCRNKTSPEEGPTAIRLKTEPVVIAFEDLIQGQISQQLEAQTGDFIIRRKDTLFAYQLAVVVDDEFQQVTHVIRGHDLLDSTPRQIYLQEKLGYSTPCYGHVPVVVNELGQKLSKQHFAVPVSRESSQSMLFLGLKFLAQDPPAELQHAAVSEQLDWATAHWHIHTVPKLANIPQDSI